MFCKKKTPTSCTSLLERREGILSVFTRTRDELVQLIEDQQAYSKNLEDQITALSVEKVCADHDMKESSSILSKINNFLK